MISKSIGSVLELSHADRGFEFKTECFYGSVQCYSKDTVRIRLRPLGCEERNHSYAVSRGPDDSVYHIEEDDSSITMTTDNLRLVCYLNPFRVRLEDAQGNILSEDDEAFGTTTLGTEVCTYRKLQEGERFLGMGEKVGPLDKRGHAFSNWNTDKFGYAIDEDPLYLSIPFYIGVHEKGTYGLFLNNSHRSTFNFGASSHRYSWFSAEDGEMDYFLFAGESMAHITTAYTDLTGRMPIPPKWSLGFQQCRYSYYPDDEIKTLARTFREKKIPADVLYLDIHYMQDYKAFTFNEERFPDPITMHEELAEAGFRTVAIVDPGIKVEEGYGTYDRGVEKDVFVKMPDGENYQGEVWPGWSHFPDYTKPSVREWWANELSFYKKAGVSGIWNDMNEPAAWGQSLPSHLEFHYEGVPTSHKEARNVYGMQMARASREGVKRHLDGERPFILTRAGFSGIQKYSAVWTGDNVSSEEHMLLACRMQMGLGLSGISFSANDIGGFAGEASPELFARWVSIGAFQPMFRAHTQVNHKDAEPWSFGEEVEQICRNYISLRYRLMPYIYASMVTSARTGLPLMRSIAMMEPLSNEVYDESFQNQFLCGESILVAPCRSDVSIIEVYLPQGMWYDAYTDEVFEGGRIHFVKSPVHKLPLFIRAGGLIPEQSQVQSTAQSHDGILRLHIYMGDTGEFQHYEDDGISYAHENGDYCKRNISLGNGSLVIDKQSGTYKSDFHSVEAVFHGGDIEGLECNDAIVELTARTHRFISPITGIDTFFQDKGIELESQVVVGVFPWSEEIIKLKWI